MATVYRATQVSLHREVALKLLSPELAADPAAADRFLREGRIAAHLENRHIVGIHDVGIHEGQPYLAMEYLSGGSVATQGALDPQMALTIVREIALALDHAHSHGVIHRDIKPENILIRADGSHALSDFGIARTMDNRTVMTQQGVTLGTPHYMSPEQLQGQEVDGRSDLYSLGVVLYQLLTGNLPYQGTDGWAIGVQHITASLPELPAPLRRYQPLINALMAKKPEHRPQTGAAVAQMIEAIQANRTPSYPTQVLALPATAKRRGLVLAATVGVALLAWGAWHFWPARTPAKSAPAVAASPASAAVAPVAPTEDQRSIAVLPLTNIGGDPANEYFSDGLAETTLDMLARVPDLKVIARTSSFAFKGKSEDVREIGKALGVANLLEGSVQRSGEMVRITVQLVRTSDGTHVWSQHYDRKMADVFKIQDEVATEVVKALQGALPAADQLHLLSQRTENVAAYQEYLKGIGLLPKRTVTELRGAAGHFERAIQLDPGYARAYAAAAATYDLLSIYSVSTPEETRRRAQYVDRALELEPDLGEAYIERARILQEANDLKGAEAAFKRGIALAPSYATGFQWYADMVLGAFGQPEKSLPLFERAIALDPLSPILRVEYASALVDVGRLDDAMAISDKLLADRPDFVRGYRLRAELLLERSDLVGALRAMDTAIAREPASEPARVDRCRYLQRFGALPEARACAAKVAREFPMTDRQRALELGLRNAEGDFATSLQVVDTFEQADPWRRPGFLTINGHPDEALAIYRTLAPELFKRPLGSTPVPFPAHPVDIAFALLKAGDKTQADELLRHSLRMTAGRPFGGNSGRFWSDVLAYALLGDVPKACAAMADAADKGFIQGYATLNADPAVASLRPQPCFQLNYNRIRAMASKQVQAARAAGLL